MTPIDCKSVRRRGLPAVLLLATAGAAVAQTTPNEWLERMSQAMSTTDYEGIVFRRQKGESEALKVVHMVIDGVVNEKITTQEGKALEIIRLGDEVHCIFPDRKSVLIENWDDKSTLFSSLPRTEIRFGAEYDLSIIREERVADRRAIMLAIRPHDSYRFGHRIWLDHDTAFPLRTQLVNGEGDSIEELKFVDISLDSDIAPEAFSPTMSLKDYTWYREPARATEVDIDTGWENEALPAGFRAVSTRNERLPGADKPVTHIVYSDGLATVSVFITEKQGQVIAERWNVGSSNSYHVDYGDYQITAVGEVPAETVQLIATGMRQP